MRTIKLMADYFCWPLWEASLGQVGNINPDELPLSTRLKNRLQQWAAEFDTMLVMDDPVRSGFATPEAKVAFTTAGLQIAYDLEQELGPAFRITVFGSE